MWMQKYVAHRKLTKLIENQVNIHLHSLLSQIVTGTGLNQFLSIAGFGQVSQ